MGCVEKRQEPPNLFSVCNAEPHLVLPAGNNRSIWIHCVFGVSRPLANIVGMDLRPRIKTDRSISRRITYPVSATGMQGLQTSLVLGWEKFLPALAYLLCLMLLGSCLTRCAHPICGACSALPVVGAVTRIMARQSSRSTNKSRGTWSHWRQLTFRPRTSFSLFAASPPRTTSYDASRSPPAPLGLPGQSACATFARL